MGMAVGTGVGVEVGVFDGMTGRPGGKTKVGVGEDGDSKSAVGRV
jgi:hypothetical protein